MNVVLKSLVFSLATVGLATTTRAQNASDEAGSPVLMAQAEPQAQPQSAPPPNYVIGEQYAPVVVVPKRSAANVLYIEGLGNGGLYSLNYERLFADVVSLRVGFSYAAGTSTLSGGGSTSSSSWTWLTVPVMVNYLGIGNDRHHLELGAGILFLHVTGSTSTTSFAEGGAVGGTATLGYRLQPREGGFVFRAGFTPIFGRGGILPWGGISLGGAF